MGRMERVMIILVFVGLIFNALTFLTVAHYFRDGPPAASAAQNPGASRTTDTAAETQRKLQGLETTLNSLKKSIDGLASRSAAQPSFSAAGGVRGSRNRAGMPRRPSTA